MTGDVLFGGDPNVATEIQYKVFKEVYDEETKRYDDLEKRSNLYLTVITFYLGAIIFKLDDVRKFGDAFHVSMIWFAVIAAVLALALLSTVAAVQIRAFEGICDLEEEIAKFEGPPISDSDFLDDRLADLAVATSRNSLQNERIALTLRVSSGLLLTAVLIQTVMFVRVFGPHR
jgi:hypothetical protein